MFAEFAYKQKFVWSIQIRKKLISVSNAIILHSK